MSLQGIFVRPRRPYRISRNRFCWPGGTRDGQEDQPSGVKNTHRLLNVAQIGHDAMIAQERCLQIHFTGVFMRRFFSITAIMALISSSASPFLTTACHHAGPPLACHRTQQHRAHCPGMAMSGHHHDDAPMPESETATVQGKESSGNCPMDCCTPGHPKNATTAAHAAELPSLAVIERLVPVVSVVFTRHGFSSHTDRGPPAA